MPLIIEKRINDDCYGAGWSDQYQHQLGLQPGQRPRVLCPRLFFQPS